MNRHTTVARVFLVALIATLVTMPLVACTQQSSSSTSSSTASASGSASASSSSSSTQAAPGAADQVTIALDYNAGTGYEWTCSMDPEGVVALVNQETKDLAKDKTITGGPLQEVFTLRAQKPGEVAVTFNLVRSWEGEPAETQVYAFTVSDDLKMVLNPYKSNFDREPEWNSNS